MAKTKQDQQTDKGPKKPVNSSSPTSAPFTRSLIIIGALSVIFVAIYMLNAGYSDLRSLDQERRALQQNPSANGQRLDELNHRIHDIETDTGFIKTLFFGYYYDVHSVAFGAQDQIDQAIADIKEDKTKFGQDNSGPITREDKLASKVHTFRLMDFVNANCPPNAVILLPPADSLSGNSKWNFVWVPMWVEYFIYPRLCIASGTERLYPDLAKRITHVLIVKGIGYDKLPYEVPADKREPLCLMPIHKPTTDTTQTSN